jgi:hypothetical protein
VDELGLDPDELGQETYDFPGHLVHVRVVHLPSRTFGEANGERWEQWSLFRKARAELAEKLNGGGGSAGMASKIPPGLSGPHVLSAEGELPQDDR